MVDIEKVISKKHEKVRMLYVYFEKEIQR